MIADQEEAVFNRMGTRVNAEKWEEFFNKREKLMQRSLNVNAYRRLEREILSFNAVELMKPGKKAKSKLDKIKNDPLMGPKMKLDSFDTKFRFNMIQALLALYEYDFRKEAHYFKEILKLIDSSPEMKDAYYKEYYIVTHYNYNVATLMARDYKAAQQSIEELRKSFYTNSKSQNSIAFFFLMNNESDLCMATGDTKRAHQVLKEMEEGIPLHLKYIPDGYQLHLLSDKANLLFLCGDHKASSALLTELINDYSGTGHRDKTIFIRLLLMLNYYEMQKYDMIDYVLGSTDRLLKKMERVYKTEKLILDSFRKLKTGHRMSTATLQELHSKMDLILDDKEEASTLFHFDIMSWIDSKIRNTSFAQLLQERSRSK
jgi:hypothetical protein